ncbi:MAG: PTS sugar transporter subunit IIC, partial [Clostridia bacterium]|nr:PTS sugar transporter subunit IIC [Clostridia bacterium]
GSVPVLLTMLLVHVVLPVIISLAVDAWMRRIGWVKKGDMKINA